MEGASGWGKLRVREREKGGTARVLQRPWLEITALGLSLEMSPYAWWAHSQEPVHRIRIGNVAFRPGQKLCALLSF